MEAPFDKMNPFFGPVYKTTILYITATYCQIGAPVFTGMIQSFKIIGIMGKIGIHFKNKSISLVNCPFKTMNISCAEVPVYPFFLQGKARPEYLC